MKSGFGLVQRATFKRRKGYSGLTRGRPVGSRRRLLDDPDRFRIATYVAATDCLGLGKYQAAHLVTLIYLSTEIRAGTVQGNVAVVSGNPGYKTREADKGFVRKVAKLTRGLSPIECDWLAGSATSLVLLLTQSSTPLALDLAINQLFAYGWRETLLGMAARLQPALLSNLPPTSESLSKSVQRALRVQVGNVVAENQ